MEELKEEYMENLRKSNDIEEIQQLLEQLKIIEDDNNQIQKIEQNQTPKENNENEEIILAYNSPSDSEYDEIFMEKGETSGVKQEKRKWDEYYHNKDGA